MKSVDKKIVLHQIWVLSTKIMFFKKDSGSGKKINFFFS